MELQSKTAIYTAKFAAKSQQKMNTENHLVQHTFKFKRKKNVVKKFLQLIDTHFPPTNKLHGIS